MISFLSKSFLFVFITIAVYLSQIGPYSDYALTFKLVSHEDKIPKIDIFYAVNKDSYTPHQMLQKRNTQNNRYTYRLQHIEKSHFLRLDPSRGKGIYSLSEVKIIEKQWLSQYVYTVPLESIKSIQYINPIKKSKKSLKFEVTDEDPQFQIELQDGFKNLALEKRSLFYRPFLDKFLISILLTIILFMLFYIFKSINKYNRFYTITKLFLYTFFFIFAIVKTSHYINTVVAFHPPDESQHLAYVKYLHQNNSVVIPKFEDMRNLYDTGYSYLGHPPLYYHILNFAFNKDVTTNRNLPLFRYISSLIFLLSFLLLLYLGWIARLRLIGDIVYLSLLSSVPLLAYLGASINNDNLAFLGASLFFVAFFHLVNKQYTNTTYTILGLSIFIAYFAKLTVVIFIFLTLFFYLLYLLYKKTMIKINILQIIILACFASPILYYQWHIFSEYHALMPGFKVTHPEAFLKSPYYVEETKRVYLSAYEWFERMSLFSFVGWFNIQSHHYFFKSNWIDYIGVVSIHLLAIFSLFVTCEEKYKTICIVGKITLLAFMSVFIVQYFFTYANHIKHGYMGGIQSRYLLPFLGAFAIMSSVLVNKFSKNIWLNILVIILCIHAIYSDFFYFLLYYK